MVSTKEIKKIAGKNNKKIGKDALLKIEMKIKKNIQMLIKKASRNADLSGRKIIKSEDIDSSEE